MSSKIGTVITSQDVFARSMAYPRNALNSSNLCPNLCYVTFSDTVVWINIGICALFAYSLPVSLCYVISCAISVKNLSSHSPHARAHASTPARAAKLHLGAYVLCCKVRRACLAGRSIPTGVMIGGDNALPCGGEIVVGDKCLQGCMRFDRSSIS